MENSGSKAKKGWEDFEKLCDNSTIKKQKNNEKEKENYMLHKITEYVIVNMLYSCLNTTNKKHAHQELQINNLGKRANHLNNLLDFYKLNSGLVSFVKKELVKEMQPISDKILKRETPYKLLKKKIVRILENVVKRSLGCPNETLKSVNNFNARLRWLIIFLRQKLI